MSFQKIHGEGYVVWGSANIMNNHIIYQILNFLSNIATDPKTLQ